MLNSGGSGGIEMPDNVPQSRSAKVVQKPLRHPLQVLSFRVLQHMFKMKSSHSSSSLQRGLYKELTRSPHSSVGPLTVLTQCSLSAHSVLTTVLTQCSLVKTMHFVHFA